MSSEGVRGRLIEAINSNNAAVVLEIVKSNPLGELALGQAPLRNACHLGHLEIINILLDAGVGANEIGTPLDASVRNGNFDVFKILLESLSLDKVEKYSYGRQSIITAAKTGDLEIIKYILSKFPQMDTSDALRTACGHEMLSAVIFLVDSGTPVNPKKGGTAPLSWACAVGNSEIADFLISHGADIRAHDNDAILSAVGNGHTDLALKLIEMGADLQAVSDKAFRRGINGGFKKITDFFLEMSVKGEVDFDLEGSDIMNHALFSSRDPSIALDILYAGGNPLSIGRLDKETALEFPILREMRTAKSKNTYEYMIHLANKVYPKATSAKQIDILAQICSLSETPYVRKRIMESRANVDPQLSSEVMCPPKNVL